MRQLVFVLLIPFFMMFNLYATDIEKKIIQLHVKGELYQVELEDNLDLNALGSNGATFYKGKIIGEEDSFVRLAFYNHNWNGNVYLHDTLYNIDIDVPLEAKAFLANGKSSTLLEAKDVDLSQLDGAWCGSKENTKRSTGSGLSKVIGFSESENRSILMRAKTNKYFNLRLALDSQYVSRKGGADNARNGAISTVNQVDGIYTKAFELSIKITTINVMQTEEEDLLSDTTNSSSLLSEVRTKNIFSDWTSGATSHLLTGRRMASNVAGIAYMNTFCQSYSYGLSSDTHGSTAYIMAHELGHTFGADHDSSEYYNLMYPSISGSDTFTEKSRTEMSRALVSGCIHIDEDVATPISALFEATPISGYAPLTVTLNASGSTPSSGSTLSSYAWSVSDGRSLSATSSVSTLFESAGTYTITLQVNDSAGESATISKQITVLEEVVLAPSAPTSLSAVESNSVVSLSWSDTSDNEDSFLIYRDGVQVASLSKNSTSYVDSNVEKSTTYSYKVYAKNSTGISDSSNTVSITLEAEVCSVGTISDLKASNITSSGFDVTWSEVSEASGYVVSLWTGASWSEISTQSASYTFANLNGTTQYVRARALKACGSGVDSNYITITLVDEVDETPDESLTTSVMTSPTAGSSLEATTITFVKETGSSVTDSYLYVGLAKGGRDIYSNYIYSDETKIDISSAASKTLYVRLWRKISGTWYYNDYEYQVKAVTQDDDTTNQNLKAKMVFPLDGATLESDTVEFSRDQGAVDFTYYLYVGNSLADNSIYSGYFDATKESVDVSSATGSTIYVRLWSKVNSVWTFVDYTYQKADANDGSYDGGSTAPVASYYADRYSGANYEAKHLYVVVDAGNSSPWDGNERITRLEWVTSTGVTVVNQIRVGILLSTAGEQLITLNVYNAAGEKHSVTKAYFVGADNGAYTGEDVDGSASTSSSASSQSSETSSSSQSSESSESSQSSESSSSSSSSSENDGSLNSVELVNENNYENISKTDITFVFNPAYNASRYAIQIGTSYGARDIAEEHSQTGSITLSKIDTDAEYIHVTAWYVVNNAWQYETFQFKVNQSVNDTGSDSLSNVGLTSENQYKIIATENLVFEFKEEYSDATNHALQLGTSYGESDLFEGYSQTGTIAVGSIDSDATIVYATVWYLRDSIWQYETYEFRLK